MTMVMSAKPSFFNPKSSKALIMMVVDDMASIPPKKILSITLHPIRYPEKKPTQNMMTISATEAMMAVAPTLKSFRKLNSRPRANSKKMIPISDHSCTEFCSMMVGNRLKWGPTKKPATMYPNTNGCFNSLNITVITPAEMRMSAKSLTK